MKINNNLFYGIYILIICSIVCINKNECAPVLTFHISPVDGALGDFLYNQTIIFPIVEITVPSLGANITLINLVCYHIEAESIDLSISFGYNLTTTTKEGNTTVHSTTEEKGLLFNMIAEGVSLNCTSDFNFTRKLIPRKGSGDLELTLSNSTLDLSFSVDLNKTNEIIDDHYSNKYGDEYDNLIHNKNDAITHIDPTSASSSLFYLLYGSFASLDEEEKQIAYSLRNHLDLVKSTHNININNNNVNTKQQQQIKTSIIDSLTAMKFPTSIIPSPETYNNNNNNKKKREIEEIEEIEEKTVVVIDDDDEAPVFQATVRSCNMNASVSYFKTSSTILNGVSGILINTIEAAVPTLVCGKVQPLIESNITAVVNVASFQVWNATKQLEDPDEKPSFNLDWFILAFSIATVIWLVITATFVYLNLTRDARANYYVEPAVVYNEQIVSYEDTHNMNMNKANNGNGVGSVPEFGENSYLITSHVQQHQDVVNPEKSKLVIATEEEEESLNRPVAEEIEQVPIMLHSKLGWYVKYPILLLILYNMAFFASGTISAAAHVYLYITVGQKEYKFPSLYTFTLWSSVSEMWEAGVWPLAILIGGTSGIWPYIKLFLMLICWITPTSILPINWRSNLLKALDALGKWSLIDAYVLVFFLEAFRVYIPVLSAKSWIQIDLDMVVESDYGFFAYLSATMLSLTLTHVILYYHRKVAEQPVPKESSYEALWSHHFEMGGIWRTGKFNIFGKLVVAAILLVTAGVVSYGAFVESFSFSYDESFIGTLLEATGQDSTKDYSIISLLRAIPDTTLYAPNGIGIRVIQITFVLFVLAIPLSHIASMLFVWIVPLTSAFQHMFFVLVEVFNAWSALEVFIVAVLIALLELEQFAEFIISDKCDALDVLIAELFPNTKYTNCFTVSAAITNGTWILLAAVIVLFVVGFVVMMLCSKAVEERIEHYYHTASELYASLDTMIRECSLKNMFYRTIVFFASPVFISIHYSHYKEDEDILEYSE